MSNSHETESALGPITLDMISSGVDALLAFNPEKEEPEGVVFEIIHRAFAIAQRNQLVRLGVPGELSLPSGSHLARLSR